MRKDVERSGGSGIERGFEREEFYFFFKENVKVKGIFGFLEKEVVGF